MKIRERLIYILKHNTTISYMYKHIMSILFQFIGLFIKQDHKLVLFSSFAGKKFNDSPKVLFEHMKANPNCMDYTFVWAFENPDKFDIEGAQKVKIDTLAYFILALKARIWITSVNIERGLKFKKKNTLYINTWHGAGTKKIGNACPNRNDYDLSTVDYMLVQSDFEKEIFIRDFNCNKKAILMCGFPRNDELFFITDEIRESFRKYFGIPAGKKVILYAPTWRDSVDGGLSYKVTPPIDIIKWKDRLKDEYVILFRMHPFTNQIDNLVFDEFTRDVTNYDNLNHILAITDILITDYSTIIYDSSAARIPFLCFGFDYDTYEKERGFYFDLRTEYPKGVLYTEDQVLDAIDDLSFDEKYEAFRNKYIQAGGKSTSLLLNKIDEFINSI